MPTTPSTLVLAKIEWREDVTTIHLADRNGLHVIDTLLAAMPTQVLRGNGIQDSHLGLIETQVDWLRLLRNPSERTLADVVSEVDALTAIAKVEAWIGTAPRRFRAAKSRMPDGAGRGRRH